MTPEIEEQQPINTSGISTDVQLAAQPQLMETDGVTKALSILDKADQFKTAGVLSSPATALKASRQVGTVTGTALGKGGSFSSKVPLVSKPMLKETSMKPKLAAQATSDGALHRAKQVILSRAQTRAEADMLFDSAPESRSREQGLMGKLFVQTPGAETMAPALVKNASKNVDAFFEKVASRGELTTAQLRYPELLDIVKK
jgi:hypothetical protein